MNGETWSGPTAQSDPETKVLIRGFEEGTDLVDRHEQPSGESFPKGLHQWLQAIEEGGFKAWTEAIVIAFGFAGFVRREIPDVKQASSQSGDGLSQKGRIRQHQGIGVKRLPLPFINGRDVRCQRKFEDGPDFRGSDEFFSDRLLLDGSGNAIENDEQAFRKEVGKRRSAADQGIDRQQVPLFGRGDQNPCRGRSFPPATAGEKIFGSRNRLNTRLEIDQNDIEGAADLEVEVAQSGIMNEICWVSYEAGGEKRQSLGVGEKEIPFEPAGDSAGDFRKFRVFLDLQGAGECTSQLHGESAVEVDDRDFPPLTVPPGCEMRDKARFSRAGAGRAENKDWCEKSPPAHAGVMLTHGEGRSQTTIR